MTPQHPDQKYPTQTSLEVGGHSLVITLTDAGHMRDALQSYLTNAKEEIARNVPRDLLGELENSVGDAWIDPSGHVRMGMWLLETKKGAPMLTFRPLPPGSYQYVARLEHKGSDWKVTSITFNPILVRR